MLLANSFDLWQKDIFFSAAEEVQKSADIMESAYRTWVRERREGVAPQYLDELRGELQMALGTAKWQLEEFEKAVRLSYRNRADEITMTRHRNFVSAIETQISRVEAALRESYNMEGKEPLPWVSLDENECDDLAQFLSGSLQAMKDVHPKVHCTMESLLENHKTTKDFDLSAEVGKRNLLNQDAFDLSAEVGKRNLLNQDAITCNIAAHFTIEQEIIEISESRHNENYQADRLLSSENAINNSALEIVIDNGYGQMATSMSHTEITPKEKGFKPPFWRPRCEDHRQAKGLMLRDAHLMRLNWIVQLLGQLTGYRQVQVPLTLRSNRSIRLMLILMLTIFLVVPFLLCST